MALAVYEHHTEIAMLLVHRGADVNIIEEVNSTRLAGMAGQYDQMTFTWLLRIPCRMETVH